MKFIQHNDRWFCRDHIMEIGFTTGTGGVGGVYIVQTGQEDPSILNFDCKIRAEAFIAEVLNEG